jgi:acyl dehydratase
MSCEITLGEKLPEVIIGPFDADALQRYADVSGDMNPLHLDETLAQSIGFSLPPVHGMKILAAFEPMLKNWQSELIIIALSGKFVQPILRGESVKLTGKVLSVSDTEIFVRLFAHGPQRLPAIRGEARLRPPSRPSA